MTDRKPDYNSGRVDEDAQVSFVRRWRCAGGRPAQKLSALSMVRLSQAVAEGRGDVSLRRTLPPGFDYRGGER